MNQQIKLFLKNYFSSHDRISFSLWHFYKHPSDVLNDSFQHNSAFFDMFFPLNEKVIKKSFLVFLNCCFDDKDFLKRITSESLREISSFIQESKNVINDAMLIDFWNHHYKNYQFRKQDLDLFVSFINYKSDYLQYLDKLEKKITTIYEDIYEEKIYPILRKEDIFDKILSDNYSYLLDCFLFSRNGNDMLSFEYLVCDNDFLDLVQNSLLHYSLPSVIIDHIIEIISTGIRFKTKKFVSYDMDRDYTKICDKIEVFDLNKAYEIISLLRRKKHDIKVISFEQKKRIRNLS